LKLFKHERSGSVRPTALTAETEFRSVWELTIKMGQTSILNVTRTAQKAASRGAPAAQNWIAKLSLTIKAKSRAKDVRRFS